MEGIAAAEAAAATSTLELVTPRVREKTNIFSNFPELDLHVANISSSLKMACFALSVSFLYSVFPVFYYILVSFPA